MNVDAPENAAPGAVEGSCLCGAVGVTLPGPVHEVDACHCSMCRTISGGGPMFAVEARGRPVITGQEHITTYRSSDWAERGFCGVCGTAVFHHRLDRDDFSLSAGLFDCAAMHLTKQIFVDEKPAMYDLANETPRLTGKEVIAWYTGVEG